MNVWNMGLWGWTFLSACGAFGEEHRFPQASDSWYTDGQRQLQTRLNQKRRDQAAKNVILFVGDGMGISTVTAGRIFAGQNAGLSGEEHLLSFEQFPHLALSKTYNDNAQTPDSAGTMSAMVTGVKTRQGVLSITREAARGDCTAAQQHPAMTLAELAELAGMATGVVSTARITHATPGAVYAHSADRNWEDDSALPPGTACSDIAAQLLAFPYGDGLEVALGGGRRHFMPTDATDPEYSSTRGRRRDGRDLTAEWIRRQPRSAYVWNQAQFDAIQPGAVHHLLGLFEPSHMLFASDRHNEPSLAEMTRKAIAILEAEPTVTGYFLMVEGGRIDHAHHSGNAARALVETEAFAEAVDAARALTSPEDTLIVVTADHSHTFVMAGYARRGNPILGKVQSLDERGEPTEELMLAADGKPYTTLAYVNGPGAVPHNAPRPDLTEVDTTALDFRQQSGIPMRSETHAGEDVAIYADGPRAFLFDGVVEQNYIFHVIEHALSLRERAGVQVP